MAPKPPRKKVSIWIYKELSELQQKIKKLNQVKPQTSIIKKERARLLGQDMSRKRAIEDRNHIEIVDKVKGWL